VPLQRLPLEAGQPWEREAQSNARMHVLLTVARSDNDYTHAHIDCGPARARLHSAALIQSNHLCRAEQQMMIVSAPPKQLMVFAGGLLILAAAIAPAAAQPPATVQPTSGTSSTTVQKHPFNGLDVR
jgi:hypothetical protein